MSDTAYIAKRLRTSHAGMTVEAAHDIDDLHDEAAVIIESQAAEIERLKAALRSCVAAFELGAEPHGFTQIEQIAVEAARAALADTAPEADHDTR